MIQKKNIKKLVHVAGKLLTRKKVQLFQLKLLLCGLHAGTYSII